MKQFSFVLDDVKRSKLYYLRFFIQIVAVLLLSGLCLAALFEAGEFFVRYKTFDVFSKAYLVREASFESGEQYTVIDDAYLNRIRKLAEYIASRDDFKLSLQTDESIALPIDKPPLEEMFFIGISTSCLEGTFPVLHINSGFSEVYDLSVSEGRGFDKADFYPEGEMPQYPPALLGSGYKEYYKVGDIVEDVYEQGRCEVVGFLKDSAFFLQPGASAGVYYLRDYIVVPMIMDGSEDAMLRFEGMIHDNATLITDDPSAAEELAAKLKELCIFKQVKLISYDDQFEYLKADYRMFLYTYGGIAMLVLLFCVSCAVASMLNYIDAHRTELSIHMLVGAKKRELLIRLAIPPALLLLLASLISLIVFKDLKVFVVLLIFDFLLLFAIMLLPARKLRQQKLYDLLKER